MTGTRIRLSRAELYEKAWATPMRTLAKEFGLSDVGLAKICRKHDIPSSASWILAKKGDWAQSDSRGVYPRSRPEDRKAAIARERERQTIGCA